MENQDPDHQPKPGRLDSRKKIQVKSLSLRNKAPILKRSSQSLVEEPEDSANYLKASRNSGAGNASTASRSSSNDVMLTENNDSLCDFRSPIKDNEMNDSLADFKVKPIVSKTNKRLARKEGKSYVSKKPRSRDNSSNLNQPSIASSFFKPATIKTAFVCPVCLKSYKDSTAQHNHMKSCAAKNKISTDKLLDAVQLQEKQANERKAMGLLAAPPIQPKKTISRKLISDKDPELQIALALSMSLHEAQLTEDLEEAHLLAGEPFLPVNAEMTEERRKTLQNFGFTTNKPVTASTSGKSRKKRPTGPTALQIRTQEERDRLTTVRIAEVLMGDEPITQAMSVNAEKVVESKENIVLKSRLLRSYHCVEDRLWDKTQQCRNDQNSYSCDIVEVAPCKAKPEPEIKQPLELETPIKETNNVPDIVIENSALVPKNQESASKSAITDNKKATAVKPKVDENSLMNLSKDWRRMCGLSYMSDVLVVVKGDIEIHAHQVVFFARCNEILSDVTRADDPDKYRGRQHMISWPETERLSAEAFLEYIYCGVIERNVSVFDEPDMLAGVRSLARKYRVKKLFAYLRDKSNELKSEKRLSKVGSNLELNTSDEDSSSLSEEESICSAETDINSVSTACNETTSNKPVIEERNADGDNLPRKNVDSLTLPERDDASDNLIVDCFSSSNDSFAMQIPTTSSTKTMQEKLLNSEMGKRISTSVTTALNNETDTQSLTKSTLSLSRTSHGTTQDNNTHLKLMNNILEEDRCISPDIFDDSTNASSAYTYTVAEKVGCDPEHDMDSTDADIEVVSTSNKKLGIEGPDLNEKSARVENIAPENVSGKLEESKVDCPFVSTRRGGRSSKRVPADVGTSSLESDNLHQGKKGSEAVPKKKGDITLAIEKIQRLNAKTASESDSDCESIETLPAKRYRNPFRINVHENSSRIEEIAKNDSRLGSDDEIPLKRRNKLSIFEKKIEKEAAKNPAMFNLTPHKPASNIYKERKSGGSLKSKSSSRSFENAKFDEQEDNIEIEDRIEPSQRKSSRPDDTAETIFDLTQESSRESKLDSDEEASNATVDDRDLSMFEKYKRNHRVNSIDKYRTALQNLSSRTSVSSTKDKKKPLSSEDSLSSNDEVFDTSETSNKVKRNSYLSKYEYTDPNQSTSNVHRELSNILLKRKERINISPEILSSESNDGEQSTVKLSDVELSDLEIDMPDISDMGSLGRISDSKADGKSQHASVSKRQSSNRSFDDKREIDSLSDIKLEDTDFSIMKNDCGTKKTNISDQETDTECCIEPISHSKQSKSVGEIRRRSDGDHEKSNDIYNEETDTGEMEEKSYQPRSSGSNKKADTVLDIASKEIPKLQSSDEDIRKISSPECGISAILSPQSMNVDSMSNLASEVDDFLDECRARSQSYRNSHMKLDDSTSRATTSGAHELSSTPRIPRNDLHNISLLNGISDSEFDHVDFLVNQDSPEINHGNNSSADAKSADVRKEGKTMDEKTENNLYVLDSDSSDNERSNIYKTKSTASIPLSSTSKEIVRKRSIQSRRQSITPEKSSRSSLRKLTAKSVSENIIKTKSKSGVNLMDDSFDRELARVTTPPVQERNESGFNDQKTPQQQVPSENVTPLANYSAMKTPELRKELQKYGLKAQKRHRAKQLLRYIYDELHPVVPVGDKNVASYSSESSSEDERPAPKRLIRSNSFEAINSRINTNNIDSDCETLASDIRTLSDASNDNEHLENNDLYALSQSDNCEGLENVFRKLLEVDRSLHNKVLTYEPLILEDLHATIKAQGLKCNLNALMDFLDEQSITFRTMANAKKNRTRRKGSPKKGQGTQRRVKNVEK